MVGGIDVGQHGQRISIFQKCLSRLEIGFQRLQGTHGGHGLGHRGLCRPLDGCTVGRNGSRLDSSVNPSRWVIRKMRGRGIASSIHGAIWDHQRPWLTTILGPACGPALVYPFALLASRAWKRHSTQISNDLSQPM